MEEVKLIVGFLVKSANKLFFTLSEYWFFSALFGVFIIAIAVDFLIAACSHFKLIPIRGYKPLVIRAGHPLKIRSGNVKPVSYVSLKRIRTPQLDKVRSGRLSRVRSLSFGKLRTGNLSKLKVSLMNLRFDTIRSGFAEGFRWYNILEDRHKRKRQLDNELEQNNLNILQNEKKIKDENHKILAWTKDLALVNNAIRYYKKKGGLISENKIESLEARKEHLLANIEAAQTRISGFVNAISNLRFRNREIKYEKKHKLHEKDKK